MPYNTKVVETVRARFEEKIRNKVNGAETKKREIYQLIPEVAIIDLELSKTYMKIVDCIIKNDGTDDVKFRISKLRDENLAQQKRRADLLISRGYKENYTEPDFDCKVCNDTGYIGENLCGCFKKALSSESFNTSGLGEIVKTQNFDNFSLEFYSKEKGQSSRSPYQNIKTIYENCKKYAAQFPDFEDGAIKKNLFFCGGTGLGKTHLSSAIAQAVIEKSFDVVYDSAVTVLYSFERERFSRNSSEDTDLSSRYFECDLLIIDDLGTEFSGSMSVASLFNLINFRLIKGKATIISTNLTPENLQKKYEDRIISRIFGEYSVMYFIGDDIRFKRLDIK